MWTWIFDPIMRGPTFGSMLMCLAASLVGVFAILRKRALVGEALAHCSYPGVVVAALCTDFLLTNSDAFLSITMLIGAFGSAILGTSLLRFLEERFKVPSDPALCFILSFFFAIGLLIASSIQSSHTLLYKKIQLYLFGQAASMTDIHILIYGSLSIVVSLFIVIFFRHLQLIHFDPAFASTIGVSNKRLESVLFALLTLSVVVGIRSVGVVLMAGMVIAPPIAARAWTSELSSVFCISGCIGLSSGFLGNYLAMTIPQGLYSLPTGPMILLTSAAICLFSLLCAPKNGIVARSLRQLRFHLLCQAENSLKTLWKLESAEIPFYLSWYLRIKGWIIPASDRFKLSETGKCRAERIVRLHRLWEVYLVEYLGQNVEKVHRNAEELEHLFTPELEKQLDSLLEHPTYDPHKQPIPPAQGHL